MKVKIYGAIRSGTNLLEYALNAAGLEVINFGDEDSKNEHWKHGDPVDCADKHVFIIKDPYAWTVSALGFATEIGKPKWNIKMWRNLALKYIEKENSDGSKWMVFKYTDLINKNLGPLEKFLNLPANSLVIPPKKMGTKSNLLEEDFDPSFYLNYKYLDYLSKHELKLVKANSKHLENFIDVTPTQGTAVSIKGNAMGFGDCIEGIIISQSIEKKLGIKVIFYNKSHQFTKAFIGRSSRPISQAPPDAHEFNEFYPKRPKQWNAMKTKSRIDWLMSNLPLEIQCPIKIFDQKIKKNKKSEGRVLLFPCSRQKTRSYDLKKWAEVYKQLDAAKEAPVFVWPSDEEMPEEILPCETFKCRDMVEAASLINGCKLVLGVDSGPAHVAGILKKPFLSLLAVLRHDSLYSYYENAHSILGEGDCKLCYFQEKRGWVKECRNSCLVLNSIKPEDITEKAISICRN